MSAAWTRKEGKNPEGGLNAAGRASYKAETGGTLRPPVKAGDNPRRASFLDRMGKEPETPRCLNCKGKGWVTPSIKMYPGDRVQCSCQKPPANMMGP